MTAHTYTDDELERLEEVGRRRTVEALIEFNRQREKTPGQIVNEFEEMLEIERKRGKVTQGKRTDLSQNSEKGSESHDSWEEASESFDISKDTLSKGKQVKDKAESDDEPEEVREAATSAVASVVTSPAPH